MKVCAGIILYNPDIGRLIQCVNAVRYQTDQIIFVDNASSNINDIINELDDESFVWIKNEANMGIATALNQLINHANNNGYEWILTLDQDSICEDGMIQKQLAAAEDEKTAMVSPVIVDRGIIESDRLKDELLPEIENIKMCITSGCLTNVKAIIETGGFNEWLFVYEVDREICIRLLRKGYRLLRVNTVKLYHEHGLKTVNRRILWKKVTYRNYTPTGVYYQTRNLVYMLRKYDAERASNPLRRWIRLYLAFFVKLICEPERSIRLKAFIKGIREGFAASIEKE